MKKLICILGASGSGKTSNVEKLELKYRDEYCFAYFDKLGVPSEQEVKEKYGDWESWGIQRTNDLMGKIKNEYIQNKTVIFDVHTKPVNIEKACEMFEIGECEVILLDCSDDERKERLLKRKQPHLINKSLFEWAEFLRNEARERGYIIIDNTNLTPEEGFKKIEELVQKNSK